MVETSSLWQRRRWFALLVFGITVLCVVVFGGVGMWRSSLERNSEVVAEAHLLIVPRSDGVRPNPADEGEDFIHHNQVYLKLPLVIERAIRMHKLHELASLQGVADPVHHVQMHLSSERDDLVPKGAKLILKVKYRGEDAADCEKILDAVIDSYQEFLAITFRNDSGRTADLLEKARDVIDTDLRAAAVKLSKFQQGNPIAVKRQVVPSQIAALETERDLLRERQNSLRARKTRIDMAPDDAVVKLYAREWATKVGFESLPDDLKKAVIVMAYRQDIQETLDRLGTLEAAIEKELVASRTEMRRISGIELEELHLQSDLARVEKLFDSTMDAIAKLESESPRGNVVRVLQGPKVK